MKERPILFNGAMVRAILAGTKTQTRRVVKLPHQNRLGAWEPTRFGGPRGGHLRDGSTIPEQGGIWHTRTGDHLGCPYGQPGDHLWVRETFTAFDDSHIQYRADYRSDPAGEKAHGVVWTPSIHMPRLASRITLEIVSVRVERLHDISEADAKAEGTPKPIQISDDDPRTYRDAFGDLWELINGDGSWDANPWVWVVEFKRVTA
jgi:hypothetical protein